MRIKDKVWFDSLQVQEAHKVPFVKEHFELIDGSDEIYKRIKDVTVRATDKKKLYEIRFHSKTSTVVFETKVTKKEESFVEDKDAVVLRMIHTGGSS